MAKLGTRIKHAYNTFMNGEQKNKPTAWTTGGPSSSSRPDRPRYRLNSERTIIASIYTRIAIDVAAFSIEHVRLNEDGLYEETIPSGLNDCLNVAANIDQAGRFFRQDMASTLFAEGTMAILPVDTTLNPTENSGNWEIKTMRVGSVVDWHPQHVTVRAYNEKTGNSEDVFVPKSMVALVENPFYAVMNEPNSTLQRLVHKLSLLDNVDEISSSGKLDIIIQLPYVTKSETRKKQAEDRRVAMEEQLSGSTYGIAYADAAEKITQLNRAVENNLLEQVQYLKDELYNELGLTPEIMNGTADDVAMLNYKNRTIEPILDAVVEAMIMKFLTKTARTQGQSIMYFQSPFKMLPISKLAEVVDVLSRNQIVRPNEVRPSLGLKPAKEPQANQLINSNMPLDKQVTGPEAEVAEEVVDPADDAEAALDREMEELGL